MSYKKNIRAISLTCALFTILLITGQAQTRKIERLKNQLAAQITDAGKLDVLLLLCAESGSLNPDSLNFYAKTAKALALAQHDLLKTAMAQYFITLQMRMRGSKDSCINIADQQLKQLHYAGTEKTTYVNYYLLKARTLDNLNKTKEALNQLYPLLIEAEKQGDTLTEIKTINVMISAFVTLGDDQEAHKWCMKALQLYPRPASFVYEEPHTVTLSNSSLTALHIFESTRDKKMLDSAQYYCDKSIAISKEQEFLGSMAYALGLKGTLLGYNHKVKEGEQVLLESLATYRQMDNMYYVINAMSVLGNFYGITNQPQKGIAICKEGIELSKKYQLNLYLYQNLAGNYKLAGDYKLYGETMEQFSSIKDSLQKKNSAQALQEAQNRYEIQKNENTIIQQKYALDKKNYLVYGSFALLLIGALFTWILLKQNRKKQQLKMDIAREEEKMRSEIAVNRAEENERKRIAAELHDNLGGQLSYISSNMDFIMEAPAELTDEQKNIYLNKVKDTAKNTIADLRESIWALKKQQVEMEELADKLKLFMQHQLAPKTQIKLDVQEHIEHKTIISSAEALNIFRIFQEAINNTIKYAAASSVTLSIETNTSHVYKISLSDNGKGFDPYATYSEHYGLENMRERAKDIKASISIESKLLGGTMISIEKTAAYNTNEVLPV